MIVLFELKSLFPQLSETLNFSKSGSSRKNQFPTAINLAPTILWAIYLSLRGPSAKVFRAAVLTVESLQSLAVELPCEQGWCPPTVANLQSEQTIHVRELLKVLGGQHGGALFANYLSAPTHT